MRLQIGSIRATGFPLSNLASTLTAMSGLQIVDKTGFNGVFAWDLTWTPDHLRGHAPDRLPTVDPNGPTLQTALENQLGLRLVVDN